MLDRILTTREVLAVVPYSRVHLWRLIADGSFPTPVQLGARKIGFREADVEAWIGSRRPVAYAPATANAEG